MLVGGLKERSLYSADAVYSLVNYPAQKSLLTDFLSQPDKAADLTSLPMNGILKINVDEIYKYAKIDFPASGVIDKNHKHAGLMNTLSMNGPRALKLLYDVVEDVLKRGGGGETLPTMSDDASGKIEDLIRHDLTLPAIHRAPYTIRLNPPEKLNPICLHQLRGEHAGRVVEIRGLVSRVSPARPLMKLAVYRCDSCNGISYHAIEGVSFTPLKHCEKDPLCKKKKDTLKLSLEDSRFTSAQIVWIQELPENVPSGKVPHQIKMSVRGTDLSDLIRPGHAIRVRGFYLIQSRPSALFGASAGGDNAVESQPIIDVQEVQPLDTLLVDAGEVTQKADLVSKQLALSGNSLYEALAQNLAPAIHGHDDVKRALILQLVGGVKLQDKVRGSIHVLLVGDPGIAKSQMLLRICAVATRAKYTCGRGVSGVGLTASVTKDASTGEFTLQAGATVLADQGICCIDEFDKMNEQDRTAIHEVMEQQTVSISKAGIVATLNARTSILAAANPVGGRYDADKSLMENVGLPAALLSRFDFVFVMMDQCTNQEKDVEMARHLLAVHRQGGAAAPASTAPGGIVIDSPITRELIRRAQAYKPYLPLNLHEEITKRYVEARQSRSTETYVTARTLTGLMRLSQALAKLRFANEIALEDVMEAERLLAASKASVAERRAARRDENYTKELRTAKRWILALQPNQLYNFDEAADRLMAEKSVGLSDFDLALSELIGDSRVEYVGNGQTIFRVLGAAE